MCKQRRLSKCKKRRGKSRPLSSTSHTYTLLDVRVGATAWYSSGAQVRTAAHSRLDVDVGGVISYWLPLQTRVTSQRRSEVLVQLRVSYSLVEQG